jgi:hypothetical protein
MAALRHSLQRELFSPAEERLVGLAHVTSVGKKKKALPCFLCVAVTADQGIGAVIYKVYLLQFSHVPEYVLYSVIVFNKQVKKTEKNNVYKKKSSWPLKELKTVDGIDGNKV